MVGANRLQLRGKSVFAEPGTSEQHATPIATCIRREGMRRLPGPFGAEVVVSVRPDAPALTTKVYMAMSGGCVCNHAYLAGLGSGVCLKYIASITRGKVGSSARLLWISDLFVQQAAEGVMEMFTRCVTQTRSVWRLCDRDKFVHRATLGHMPGRRWSLHAIGLVTDAQKADEAPPSLLLLIIKM